MSSIGRASLLLVLIIGTLMSPWLMFLFLGIVARGRVAGNVGRIMLMIALVGFLAMFNATKRIEGDWYTYVTGYIEMLNVGYFDYIQGGGISVRFTEPTFYAIEFILTRLSDGNIALLAIAVSAFIYSTYHFILEKILTKYHLHGYSAAACIFYAILAGITFTQTLHLVRQYLAGAILFAYFFYILEGRFRLAFFLFFLALSLHNSSLVPAIIIALGSYLWKKPFVQKHFAIVVPALLCFGFAIGNLINIQIQNSVLAVTASKDDGGVSLLVVLMDGLLFLVSFAGVAIKKRRENLFFKNASAISVLFLAVSLGLLVGIHDLTLWFLRFYFYIEWFRVFGIITIIWVFAHHIRTPSLALLVYPATIFLINLRVANSPFNYSGDFFAHLFGSLYWWAENLVVSV